VDLAAALAHLPDDPRVVVTGNHATPWHVLGLVDSELDRYRLWALNGQRASPTATGSRWRRRSWARASGAARG